jgi:hypothetical protein
MITHDYIWRGAGATCDEAREALLTAWTWHRAAVVRQQPALAPSLPEAGRMPQHFAIRYSEYTRLALPDYPARPREHPGGNRDPDLLSRLQVHDQLIARNRLHG